MSYCNKSNTTIFFIFILFISYSTVYLTIIFLFSKVFSHSLEFTIEIFQKQSTTFITLCATFVKQKNLIRQSDFRELRSYCLRNLKYITHDICTQKKRIFFSFLIFSNSTRIQHKLRRNSYDICLKVYKSNKPLAE